MTLTNNKDMIQHIIAVNNYCSNELTKGRCSLSLVDERYKRMTLQIIGDKTAIALSFLCTVHCLILPLALIITPSIAAFSFNDEVFHQYMLAAVFVNSLFALSSGYQKHKQVIVYFWGISGLSMLLIAFILGHDLLGEAGEKVFTLLGALTVAYGHIKNYRLSCQQACTC